MKRWIPGAVAAVLAVSLAFSAAAQQKGKPQLSDRAKRMIARRLQRYDEVLKLTPQQKAKIRAILEEEAGHFRFDRNRFQNMTREERMQLFQKFRAQREKTNKRIEAVLTPPQRKKFQQMQKEMRRRGRRPRGRRPRRRPPRG